MSRLYEMAVTVSEFNPEKEEAIKDAAENEWDFEDNDWQEDPYAERDNDSLFNYGQSSLCGGEGEEEFTDRISKAIWKANGAFCPVLVRATYLEELPYEEYTANEDDYKRLMGKKA